MNDWIKKNLLGTLSLAAIIGVVIWGKDLLGLVFTSEEMRFKTEQHVVSAKSESDLYNTIKKVDTLADFAFQDAKDNQLRDSLRDDKVDRNAITIYQIKEQQQRTDSILIHLIDDLHRQ